MSDKLVELRDFLKKQQDIVELQRRIPSEQLAKEIEKIQRYKDGLEETNRATNELIDEQKREIAELQKQLEELRIENQMKDFRYGIENVERLIDEYNRSITMQRSLDMQKEDVKKEIEEQYQQIKIKGIEAAKVQEETIKQLRDGEIAPAIEAAQELKKRIKVYPTYIKLKRGGKS